MTCRPAAADENTRKRPASEIEAPAAQEVKADESAMTTGMNGMQPQQPSLASPVGLPGTRWERLDCH